MKFYWDNRCTLALLEQNHQVTAFREHKITEERSNFIQIYQAFMH